MSSALHLLSHTLPGYGPIEKGCFPCSVVSGRADAVSPCAPPGDFQALSGVRLISLKRRLRRASLSCKADPNGQRRYPDKQNRYSFNGKSNRQDDEWDSTSDPFEESELLPSKNGGVWKKEPKNQAPATAGPKEKEIMQLFRPIQEKLRQKSPARKDKVSEVPEGQSEERKGVDALLQIMKKSVNQDKGKAINGSVRPVGPALGKEGQSRPLGQDKSKSFLTTARSCQDGDLTTPKVSRPPSAFRRRSPVPGAKVPGIKDEPLLNQQPGPLQSDRTQSGKRSKNLSAKDLETELELDAEHEIDSYHSNLQDLSSALLDEEFIDEEEDEEEEEPVEVEEYEEKEEYEEEAEEEEEDDAEEQALEPEVDLDAMKVPELRELAKARGLKGYSKMKRSDLIDLLNGE